MTFPQRNTLAVLTLILVGAASVPAAPQPQPASLSAAARAEIVDKIIVGLDEIYVFPEVAAKMADHLRSRLAAGAYDDVGDVRAFAGALTEDLQSISHDKHLRVRWDPPDPDAGGVKPSDAERLVRYKERMERANYCFSRLERMSGNVGYVKLDCFARAEFGGDVAIAAMNFLARSDALIFDLRANGGGSPSMIQLISSYLFSEPKHLNSFYIRKSDSTDQFWTQAFVEGPRVADVPVYVLISPRTFSAAEEFTYNLKNMERATIVGKTTGGGAHPVETYDIEGYPVYVTLPFGRAVNPITGTNWEGTGIEPHIDCDVEKALDVAHLEAIKGLEEKAEGDRRAELAWAREGLEIRLNPVSLDATALAAYVGTYGPRVIRQTDDGLVYQREDGPRYRLRPMGGDRFDVPEVDYFRIRFERDASGRVVRFVGRYENGSEDFNDRSSS